MGNVASESKALELLTNIQSLIGYFRLDPNRLLDILMELAAANLMSHWRFLMKLFQLSPWFNDATHVDSQAEFILGDISQTHGNPSAAQILGFKFQQIQQEPSDASLLVMLAAIMIKEGLIRLQDLWPHLAPSDAVILQEKSLYQDRILDEVDKAKGRNALAVSACHNTFFLNTTDLFRWLGAWTRILLPRQIKCPSRTPTARILLRLPLRR